MFSTLNACQTDPVQRVNWGRLGGIGLGLQMWSSMQKRSASLEASWHKSLHRTNPQHSPCRLRGRTRHSEIHSPTIRTRVASGPAVSSLAVYTNPNLVKHRDWVGMPMRSGILQTLARAISVPPRRFRTSHAEKYRRLLLSSHPWPCSSLGSTLTFASRSHTRSLC